MKQKLLGALGVVLIILVVIQIVPAGSKSNPPVQSDIAAPEEIDRILRRSCYDCHSNETRWPWYSNVAPVSWLVAHDVEEAREHLNFSTWGQYGAGKKAHLLEEIWEEVEEGEMPLWFYVPLHPEAELSEADMAALKEWTETFGTAYEMKADVEEAVGTLIKDTGAALESAAEGLKKAGDRILKRANDDVHTEEGEAN